MSCTLFSLSLSLQDPSTTDCIQHTGTGTRTRCSINTMGSSSKPQQTSLFQVYLRLRPPVSSQPDAQPPQAERHLIPEPPEPSENVENQTNAPTHITLQPPNDSRKRAVERFGFTKVFEENASQLDVFQDTGMESLIKGVLQEGRDGLVATLGVTGSGKVGYWISSTVD